MKIAIVGCRDYINKLDFNQALANLFGLKDNIAIRIAWPTWVISGGARGTDEMSRLWAKEQELNYAEFPAEWGAFGKSAGYKRNEKIVKACDFLVAFWDFKSKGTSHSVALARRRKKLIGIYNIIKQEWEWNNGAT